MCHLLSNCKSNFLYLVGIEQGGAFKNLIFKPSFLNAPLFYSNRVQKIALTVGQGMRHRKLRLFFYSKKLITWEKIGVKNGQKRDFASPLLSLLRMGEGRNFGYGDVLVRETQVLIEFPIQSLEMVVLSNLLYFARQSP